MKKLFILGCFAMFMLGCSCIHKYVVNRDSMNGEVYELQVHNLQEIPEDILDNIDKMGVDESAILNEYEGKYLNFIFKINPEEFDLVGKKVAFLKVGNKAGYFDSTRSPERKGTTVGGSGLYIFDTAQKAESGGYDAAVSCWSKILLPIDLVVEILSKRE